MGLNLSAAAAIGPVGVSASIGPNGLTIGVGVAPLSPNYTPLVLDDILFSGFEIPERFGPLGGEQVMAVHDFPGGIRTIQTFGPFPPQDISWTGILVGPAAAAREQALDRKRVTGKLVTLRFGRWAWSGYVREFTADVQNLFLIPYRIKFTPLKDLSGVATAPQGATSPEATLSQDQAVLNSTTNPNTAVQPLPASMTPPVTGMQTAVAGGLQDSGGVVANIPPADVTAISAANLAVVATAKPIIAGTDAIAASPTLDARNYSQANLNTILAVRVPIAQVRLINPNLFFVAQQYYRDATLWKLIADANGLTDPQPLGEFVLQIPPPS